MSCTCEAGHRSTQVRKTLKAVVSVTGLVLWPMHATATAADRSRGIRDPRFTPPWVPRRSPSATVDSSAMAQTERPSQPTQQPRKLRESLSSRLKKTVTEHAQYVYREEESKLQPTLGRSLVADAIAASVTAFAVSPVVVLCDKSVVQASASGITIGQSLRAQCAALVTRPASFVGSRAFGLVWGVYALTYGVSNLVQTVSKRRGVDGALPTFLATAAVNIPSSVLQDRYFTAWFGKARGRFSPISYSLWAARDMATVLGSFTLPALLAGPLQRATGSTQEAARFQSQLLVPSAVALVVHPPLHLLAIDLYNRPTLRLAERSPLLSSLLPSTAAIRFARILPAFGCGGVINSRLKELINGLGATP